MKKKATIPKRTVWCPLLWHFLPGNKIRPESKSDNNNNNNNNSNNITIIIIIIVELIQIDSKTIAN